MLHQRDLVTRPVQKPKLLQPDCPVYLHAYVCTVSAQGLAACVQMRFINRGEQTVESLFLRVRGIDAQSNTSFEQNDIILAVHAGPHSVFGEEQIFFLPRRFAESLEITVERVLFENGMIWRKMPSHQLLRTEESGWIDCECGMKNPPDAEACAFCAKPLKKDETEAAEATVEEATVEIAEELTETTEERTEEATQTAEEALAEIAEDAAEATAEVAEEVPEAAEEATEEVSQKAVEAVPVILPIPESIVEEISEPIAEEAPEPAVEESVEPEQTELAEEVTPSEPEAEAVAEVQDAPAEAPVAEAAVTSSEASVYDLAQCEQIMSETAALLREIMARSAAARGESLPVPVQTEQSEEAELSEPEAPPRKRRTLLVIFWVLFLLTLVAVGLLIYFNPNGMFDGIHNIIAQLFNTDQPQ